MIDQRRIRWILLLALLALTGGCAALPRSGPDDRAIVDAAAATVKQPQGNVGIDYALVELSKDVLALTRADKSPSLSQGFGGGRGGPPSLPLGPGDILSITIFEAQAGGLFIPAEAGSRAGNYVTVPDQTVDSAGSVTVPYAGRIAVAGRSIAEVQSDIETALANRAIEPQVVITAKKDRSNQVAVLGDVNSPANLEITAAGERILDAISEAGGLSSPAAETYVTLQRRGKEATVLFDYLVKAPEENIYVAPGDTIYVNRERRTYLAFGASGSSGRFDFDDANLTLGEALGKAGGLLDDRADPAQVFVYRLEPRTLVQKYGADVSRFGGDAVATIYHANLRDPAAFFAAQSFPMKDKDILYVSNSKSVELIKLLNIINGVSTTVSGVATDAVDTKDAVRAF